MVISLEGRGRTQDMFKTRTLDVQKDGPVPERNDHSHKDWPANIYWSRYHQLALAHVVIRTEDGLDGLAELGMDVWAMGPFEATAAVHARPHDRPAGRHRVQPVLHLARSAGAEQEAESGSRADPASPYRD